MAAKFKIGDKVAEPGDARWIGEVVAIEISGLQSSSSQDDLTYHVLWPNGRTLTLDESDLMLIDPEAQRVLKENLKIKMESLIGSFEQSFKMWKDAQEMCYKTGNDITDFSRDPDIGALLRKFENVVESGGWSASSLYC